ncbi:hypothetical protein HU200_010066 [Digitaria exilis]|uniref:Uncharacterized protein n=1 Tax=Digitaria exilis TaxID=1010633 RepID=A0A835KQA3_9POAL|nr:hypothetical protein HU200_010066 [Digitaria exilis]
MLGTSRRHHVRYGDNGQQPHVLMDPYPEQGHTIRSSTCVHLTVVATPATAPLLASLLAAHHDAVRARWSSHSSTTQTSQRPSSPAQSQVARFFTRYAVAGIRTHDLPLAQPAVLMSPQRSRFQPPIGCVEQQRSRFQPSPLITYGWWLEPAVMRATQTNRLSRIHQTPLTFAATTPAMAMTATKRPTAPARDGPNMQEKAIMYFEQGQIRRYAMETSLEPDGGAWRTGDGGRKRGLALSGGGGVAKAAEAAEARGRWWWQGQLACVLNMV